MMVEETRVGLCWIPTLQSLFGHRLRGGGTAFMSRDEADISPGRNPTDRGSLELVVYAGQVWTGLSVSISVNQAHSSGASPFSPP